MGSNLLQRHIKNCIRHRNNPPFTGVSRHFPTTNKVDQENRIIQQPFSATSKPRLSMCKISKVAMQDMPFRKCVEDEMPKVTLTQPFFSNVTPIKDQ